MYFWIPFKIFKWNNDQYIWNMKIKWNKWSHQLTTMKTEVLFWSLNMNYILQGLLEEILPYVISYPPPI